MAQSAIKLRKRLNHRTKSGLSPSMDKKSAKVEEVHSPTIVLRETSLDDPLDHVSFHENCTQPFKDKSPSSWRKKSLCFLVIVLALVAYLFVATLVIDVYVKQEVWKKETANRFLLHDERASNLSAQIEQLTRQLDLLMQTCETSLELSFETKLNITTQKLTSRVSNLQAQAQYQHDRLNEKISSMNQSMTLDILNLNFISQNDFEELNVSIKDVSNSLADFQHHHYVKEKLLNDSLTVYATQYQASLQEQSATNNKLSVHLANLQMKLQSFTNDSNSKIGLMGRKINSTKRAMDTQARLVSNLLQADALVQSNISTLDTKISTIAESTEELSLRIALLNTTLDSIQVNISFLASTSNSAIAAIKGFKHQLNDTKTSVLTNKKDLNSLTMMHNSMAKNAEVISKNLTGLQGEVNSVADHVTALDARCNESTQLQWNLTTALTSQKEFETTIHLLNEKLNETVASVEILKVQLRNEVSSRLNGLNTSLDSLAANLRSESQNQSLKNVLFITKLSTMEKKLISVNGILKEAEQQLTAIDKMLNLTRARIDTQCTSKDHIDALSSELTILNSTLLATYASVTVMQSDVALLSINQTSLTLKIDEINTTVTSLDTNLDNMSTAIGHLGTFMSAPVDLYRGCYRDTTSCRVHVHPINRYWYLCTTEYLQVNMTDMHTTSTHCEHDPDASYIDTTAIEVKKGMVRCHCNVLGLTIYGHHNGYYRPTPRGLCTLVIQRCPSTPTLYNF